MVGLVWQAEDPRRYFRVGQRVAYVLVQRDVSDHVGGSWTVMSARESHRQACSIAHHWLSTIIFFFLSAALVALGRTGAR